MDLDNCQLPDLLKIQEGPADFPPQPLKYRVKRMLARPWNQTVKKFLKQITKTKKNGRSRSIQNTVEIGVTPLRKAEKLAAGDWVMVRSREEITAQLDRWHEYKGCAFLPDMWQYCGTRQRVLKRLERFLDERDYQVKKSSGLVLLEGVLCSGTPVFGRCDRACHFFWREEWLVRMEEPN
jgi:hypothetical protein